MCCVQVRQVKYSIDVSASSEPCSSSFFHAEKDLFDVLFLGSVYDKKTLRVVIMCLRSLCMNI